MPLATLKTVLELADARNAACLGFVCQGWEDARAYTAAGEAVGAPVILSAGPVRARICPSACGAKCSGSWPPALPCRWWRTSTTVDGWTSAKPRSKRDFPAS